MPQIPGYQPLPEYDALRRRLQSQYGQQKQDTTDAIQRRYAANGMLGAGAAAKSQQKAEVDVGRQQADAEAQLGFAEAGEAQRRLEVEQGREYQTKEREAQQGFASSERQAGQQFTQGMFDKDQAFKEKAFGEDTKQKWAQIDLAGKEYDQSVKANKINQFTAMGGLEGIRDMGDEGGSKFDQAMYRLFGANWRDQR